MTRNESCAHAIETKIVLKILDTELTLLILGYRFQLV